MGNNRNSIIKRLVQHVLLISAVIVVVITVFEAGSAYNNILSQLAEVDSRIHKVLLPGLAEDVWNLDRNDIVTKMGLILSQPMIEMVELTIEHGETIKVGEVSSGANKVYLYKLFYNHNDKEIHIGSLVVSAGLESIYSLLIEQSLINFLGNTLIIFLVASVVVLLTRNYVTRHLVDISNNLSAAQVEENEAKPLALNRSRTHYNREDELENVVSAINDMRANLVSSYEKVHESEQRLSQIAENSLMWIWEVDKEGLYTYCSDTCEFLFGYSVEDIVGKKHFYDLFHPDDRQELKKSAFTVFANKRPFKEFENRNINRLGATVWLSTSGVAIVDKDGNLVGYRGADVDITAKKQLMEEQSRAAQLAALGTVAAGVAHEINNPIQGIMNYASLIKRSPEKGERNAEIAERIISESERIAHITQDLLYYSKNNRVEKIAVDVKETIERALSLITTKIRSSNVEIVTDFQDDLPLANWQPQSIQQIIMNLVDNAYDALRMKEDCSGPKHILIGAKLLHAEEPAKIAITVRDNGIGMPDAVIRKAQEAFFTTKKPSEGTGLGLSIVSDIVAKHNGTIGIESSEGQYTQFTVTLPLE